MEPFPVDKKREMPVRVTIVGHVDHGKSTLVGRLFNDTGSLPDGKVEQIRDVCERRGMPFEWAFVLDALKAERDQGVTIDSAQIRFRTKRRDYVFMDAPGHKEFLKNMVTGAASADGAVLVVDAAEGVQDQTRRHGYLLHLLGVQQVTIVVNKMDLVNFDEARFRQVASDTQAYLSSIGVETASAPVVPVSARGGDNVVERSSVMPWYEGPTMSEALDSFRPPVPPLEKPLRFPVQDIYKFDERRIIAGRIDTGRLRRGDKLLFSPSNKTTRVKSVEAFNVPGEIMTASAGQSIGITLEEQLFLERGEIASHETAPPKLSTVFQARLFWLGKNPLVPGKRYKLYLATAEYPVEVEEIRRVIDVGDLSGAERDQVERNEVAEVVMRSRSVMALDSFTENGWTGRFVMQEDYNIVGGGLISLEDYPDQRERLTVRSTNVTRVEHRISPQERWLRNGHKGGILWFTGLSGAGKSTLALALEQELFRRGHNVYVLDGDNIRHGLSADLDFTPEGRGENVRRVGEVARLFARAGVIVITAFISPYKSDRDRVRSILPDLFHEVYVHAPLDVCEERDPKGLYQKARKGEIDDFTGISAPYEAPSSPEILLNTAEKNVEECLEDLVAHVEENFIKPVA